MKLLIRGATVLPMTVNEPILPETDIYIVNTSIIGIGQAGRTFAEQEADQLIDGRGKLALPGFINAHTHSPMTIMRGNYDDLGPPAGEGTPPAPTWTNFVTAEDNYWSSFLAIAEMLHSGTTTFVDMFHDMDMVGKAVEVSGIRAALGWEVMTFSTYSEKNIVYDESVAAKCFDESAQFAADWNGRAQGRITTLVAPHEVSTCHEPWLSRSARLAGELKLGITIHLAESPLDVRVSQERYGQDPVELLRDTGILNHNVIAAHCTELTESDMDLLADYSCHPIACPQCHLKLAGKTTPIPALLKRGVNVALGTDSAVTNNNLDLFEEMRLAAIIQAHLTGNAAALPGATALKLLTVNGAKALNRNDLGTLEVGKRADIVLLDTSAPHMHPLNNIYSNIIYSAAAADVWGVIVDGRVLMQDRRILTFDEADVIYQVEKRMAHLRALANA